MDPLKIALVCDFLEENWPSMDLVGDMLFEHLRLFHSGKIAAVQIRPRMRRHLQRIPLIAGSGFAWNVDRLINRLGDYPRWLRGRTGEFDLFHIIDHSYAQLVHDLPRG